MKEIIKKKFFPFPLWNAYFSIREQLFLFILVLVGMTLRIINAIYTPFWRDEIYIFYTAHTNTLWQLITQQHWDTAHPPLHSIFLHFWQLISIEPLWLRLPSLITSFFILYHLPILVISVSRKFKSLPFIFLFLFAISHTQISLNMVSRPYPFVSFLTILSLIFALRLHSQKNVQIKDTVPFICVNVLGFCIDYSFIWLFMTYFFVFIVFLIKDKERKNIFIMGRALVITQIILIPLYLILYANLSQSLHLESGARMKFESVPHTNIGVGKQLNIDLFLSKKTANMHVKNATNTLSKNQGSWVNPLLKNTQYLGFDLPPMSGMIVTELSYCATPGPTKCELDNYLHKFRVSHLRLVLSRRIGPLIFLFNFQTKEWQSFLFPVANNQSTQRTMIRTSFIPLGQDPSPEVVFATSHKNNLIYLDPDEVDSLIRVKSRNFQYEVSFYKTVRGLKNAILSSFTFIDKFGNDFLFFSGLPSFDKYSYSHFGILLILISIITLLLFLKKNKTFGFVLLLSLFFIPLLASYVISIYISPIFVARNLYAATFSYIFGIALLISAITHEYDIKKQIIGYGLLIFFIYVLCIKFPFLHYVDPPFGVDTMVHRILNGDRQKKKIIVIDNSSHYEPLLYHQLLMANNKGTTIAVVTLSSFKEILRTLTIDVEQKKNYEYYFIRFNQDVNNFKETAKFLGCKIDKIKTPYAFFAHCHH
ncbi:MAG: hypothetical protein WAV30_04740 [Microgenomates group bacterium]